MAEIEVLLPKMGESVAEATITKWLKNIGDTVEAEEPIIEIATDKVDSEVPSPAAGVITKRLFEEGAVVKVGEIIAFIGSEVGAAANVAPPAAQEKVIPTEPISSGNGQHAVSQQTAPVLVAEPVPSYTNGDRFYSPLVRNIAKTEGIGLSELEQIPGTGANGRLTKKDLINYLPVRSVKPAVAASAPSTQTTSQTSQVVSAPQTETKVVNIPVYPGDEIIEMDRMRKLIAEHMVNSKRTSAHVTSFVEADVTNLVMWRERAKKEFEKREGEKLTFTPVFIEAIVKAIKDFPMINISLSGDKIIKRKNINIGMATALPSGNLIVPVIKNADQLNLIGLTKAVNDLASRARENKLMPDEIGGGTYTISNVGSFGNLMGTPVINQPQVAIMAVGAIRKIPAVIETPQGDLIGIRSKMFLSHSYDHRIVDGSLGGMFVRRVADYLEQFDINRPI